MNYRILLITLLLTLTTAVASAQLKVSGMIVDQDSKGAIEYANVMLFRGDSTLVKGVTSGSAGEFIIEGVERGNHYLNLTYVGYQAQNIAIENLESDLSLGIINLASAATELEAVTITSDAVIRKVDRQLIVPSEAQKSISANALNLADNLQLPRIQFDQMNQTLKVLGGGQVQLRINGVEVTEKELMALHPEDVVRVEYHDEPGLRYGGAEAVLDFIVRRVETGGSVVANAMQGLSRLGFGNRYLAGSYNRHRAEISTNLNWFQRDIDWIKENFETYNLSDRTIVRNDRGLPIKFKMDNLSFNLNYSLMEEDKYLFNARFRFRHFDMPYGEDSRNVIIEQGDHIAEVYERQSDRSNRPVLDLYYQRFLKNDQLLIFNVVGSYTRNNHAKSYNEVVGDDVVADFLTKIGGDSYSVVTEGIYENELGSGKLSTGLKHTQTHSKSRYSGDFGTTTRLDQAETYAYAEYQNRHNKFSYSVGLGAMRTSNKQGGESRAKYIFRPTLRLSYSINDHFFVRYHGYVSGYSPSQGALNDFDQAIDTLQISRGNPNLRTVAYFTNSLTLSWSKGIFSGELFGRYSYDSKPIMESIFLENDKIIRTQENQRGFHRLYTQASLKFRPFKDYISISINPFFSRHISYGNDYTHARSNWGVNTDVQLKYKSWHLHFQNFTRQRSLWGENYSSNERAHVLMVGYNAKKWGVWAGMFNPFSKGYSIYSEGLSQVAPNYKQARADDFSRFLIVGASFNLNFGRRYKPIERRVDNVGNGGGGGSLGGM